MFKMIRANCFRLPRSRSFILALAAMFVFLAAMIGVGIFVPFNGIHEVGFDAVYFGDLQFFALFAFAPISLFLAVELGDGGVRRKLTVGQKRSAVYLADLAAAFVVVTALYLVWTFGGLVGIPLFGMLHLTFSGFFTYLLVGYFTVLALAALLTFVGHLTENKAVTVVVAVLLVLVLLIACSFFADRVKQPETRTFYGFNEENEFEVREDMPNPSYVPEPARTVLYWILRVLPLGQECLIGNFDAYLTAHPAIMIAISLGFTAVLTLAGMAVFQKKDLK